MLAFTFFRSPDDAGSPSSQTVRLSVCDKAGVSDHRILDVCDAEQLTLIAILRHALLHLC